MKTHFTFWSPYYYTTTGHRSIAKNVLLELRQLPNCTVQRFLSRDLHRMPHDLALDTQRFLVVDWPYADALMTIDQRTLERYQAVIAIQMCSSQADVQIELMLMSIGRVNAIVEVEPVPVKAHNAYALTLDGNVAMSRPLINHCMNATPPGDYVPLTRAQLVIQTGDQREWDLILANATAYNESRGYAPHVIPSRATGDPDIVAQAGRYDEILATTGYSTFWELLHYVGRDEILRKVKWFHLDRPHEDLVGRLRLLNSPSLLECAFRAPYFASAVQALRLTRLPEKEGMKSL
jgi:hypothetical protein